MSAAAAVRAGRPARRRPGGPSPRRRFGATPSRVTAAIILIVVGAAVRRPDRRAGAVHVPAGHRGQPVRSRTTPRSSTRRNASTYERAVRRASGTRSVIVRHHGRDHAAACCCRDDPHRAPVPEAPPRARVRLPDADHRADGRARRRVHPGLLRWSSQVFGSTPGRSPSRSASSRCRTRTARSPSTSPRGPDDAHRGGPLARRRWWTVMWRVHPAEPPPGHPRRVLHHHRRRARRVHDRARSSARPPSRPRSAHPADRPVRRGDLRAPRAAVRLRPARRHRPRRLDPPHRSKDRS